MRTVTPQRPACAPYAGCKKAEDRSVRCRRTLPPLSDVYRPDAGQNAFQHRAPVSTCLAVAAVMALHCPQADAADELSLTRTENSRVAGAETTLTHRSPGSMISSLAPHVVSDGADLERRAGREAPVLVVTDLAEATAAPAPAYPLDTMVTGTYVPGPVEVGWQIYVGSAVAAFPFVLGAYEFGKRILIQQRCETCGGNGLVKKGKFYRKCRECGGFFPWQGWKLFFTSTASPGNGGPLLQPRGQTSVLYKVPPKVKDSPEKEVASRASTTSKSGDSPSADGDDAR